jgi:purine-binding chemotaxis protein CheW
MDQETSESILNYYLTFRIDSEVFATNVGKVLEILEVPGITRVPRSPDYLRGVINLRGNVLPVIDSRIKFGMNIAEDTVNTCIVVMLVEYEQEELKVGVLVDAVQEVMEIDEIDPPSAIQKNAANDFISGVGKVNDQFIMILDVDKVFSTSEKTALSGMEGQEKELANEQ